MQPELFTLEDPSFLILLAVGLLFGAVLGWVWRAEIAWTIDLLVRWARFEVKSPPAAREYERTYTELERIDDRIWQLERLEWLRKITATGEIELLRLRSRRERLRERLLALQQEGPKLVRQTTPQNVVTRGPGRPERAA